MKAFLVALVLLVFTVMPIHAQTATASATPSATPQVKGIYDDPLSSEYSDTTSSASLTATPRPRTQTMTTTKTPTAGTTENTIVLLLGGITLVILGVRFSKE